VDEKVYTQRSTWPDSSKRRWTTSPTRTEDGVLLPPRLAPQVDVPDIKTLQQEMMTLTVTRRQVRRRSSHVQRDELGRVRRSSVQRGEEGIFTPSEGDCKDSFPYNNIKRMTFGAPITLEDGLVSVLSYIGFVLTNNIPSLFLQLKVVREEEKNEVGRIFPTLQEEDRIFSCFLHKVSMSWNVWRFVGLKWTVGTGLQAS
jgi:hypothetical protein